MSNENDCALLVGRYPEGTLLPSATDETKNIAVGGMQICAINVHNNRQYPCCWTKSGAIENCKSYCSRAAEHSVQRTGSTVVHYVDTCSCDVCVAVRAEDPPAANA